MDKTFKFRFVNEIVGAFVLTAVALLVASIFFAGKFQGMFDPKFRLHAVFTSNEGAFGLRKGSEVKIRDTVAGEVSKINPNSDGNIEATFVLKETFHTFVRTNSMAVVKKTLMITGDAYVEITVGDPKCPLITSGGVIRCNKDTAIIEQAMEILDKISDATLPALEKAQMVLDELPALTVQIRKTLKEGENVLRNDMPGVSQQAQDTLREMEILIQGVQRHWLFRKYMDPNEATPMLPPSGIGVPLLMEKAARTTPEAGTQPADDAAAGKRP